MGERIVRGLSQAFAVEQGGTHQCDKKRIVRNAALAISVGCLSAWFLIMFCSVTAYVESFDGPESALNRSYVAQAIAFALCCVVLYRQDKASSVFVESRVLPLPLAALLGIGSVVLSFSSISESTLWFLVPIGAILTAAAAAMLFGILGNRFSQLDYKERLSFCVIAFGLTAIILGVSSLMQELPAAMFAMGVALMCGVTLTISDNCKIELISDQNAIKAEDMQTAERRKLLIRFGLLVFAWRLVLEWARTMLIRGGVNVAGSSLFSQMHAVGTVAVVATVLVIIIMLALIPKRFRLSYVYRVALLTSLCAVLFTQIAFDEGSKIIPYALTSGTTVLLMMLSWTGAVFLIGLMGEHSAFQVVLFAVGMSYSGGAVGFIVGQSVDMLLPHTPLIFIVCETMAVCILVMTYLSVFTEHDLDFISRILPSNHHHRFLDHCSEIAQQYGLSKREEEIFVMLSKGRNAAFIQEALIISYNTVTTHRKRIYQKLGVHSQQELMDLVDEEFERY